MDAIKENLVPVALEQELKTSFLDYSMSVIVSRALPDVRDGLKPVQRRILYTMHELGLVHNRGFRKSAAVVGDTMGKYHPHGDQAIYDTLVRMAQDWSLRYPLIDGQGNFGSIDGDSPAAMRYTEVRMAPITAQMLADIEKQTVDMQENYDGRLQEPKVLPAAIPNLLINGSQGIAVGMATSCPPHNLGEVCDAIVHLIDNPEADTLDLLKFIKGPDFPTGAIIYGKEGLKEAYLTGRGKIQVRARAAIEKDKSSGKERIVITEIPYQVNKSRLIESIAELVRDKRIEGITDLRDESDREGMRIVVEVRKDVEPEIILNQLYSQTQLQDTFSILMLALVNNVPRVLSLADMIRHYVEHRIEIVRRRTEYDLRQAEERAHIVEGLLRAIDHIDEIIAVIRGSADADVARENLKERFGFSDAQANAILAMRLRRLTGLEREELENEYRDLLKQIERFKMILSSRRTLLAVVRRETLEIKEKYADDRRTEILGQADEFQIEDLIADEEMVVIISNSGYIKRVPIKAYRKQRRGGKGLTGADTKEEDFIRDIFVASAHQYILFFSNRGQVYWRKVHEIPKGSRTARGRAIRQILNLNDEERVTACLPVRDLNAENKFVFMVTREGIVKKTELSAFSNPRSTGIRAIELDKDDELVDIQITSGNDNILIATWRGMAIRFPEKDVRPMGRAAQGVIGIRLEADDYVIGTSIAHDNMTVLSVTENGYGKRTHAEEYRIQHRGGHGIINIKTTDRNGNVVGMLTVDDNDEIVVISTDGILIRIPVKDIRPIGRNTQGVRIMKPNEGARVSAIARAVGETNERETTGDAENGDSSDSEPDDSAEDTEAEDDENT